MWRRALLAGFAALCLAIPMAAQEVGGGYLDIYVVHVKPEKAADFDVIARKIADANRKNNGDRWLALESVYGEANTVAFISHRDSYADIDKATDVFMSAVNKAYGKEATQKLFNDFNSCLVSARSELRHRRWDLSRKPPADEATYVKWIGESRVIRTTAVHVKPGKSAEFESILKEMKEAGDKVDNAQPTLVSQVYEGGNGTTYYVTSLRPGLGGYDNNPSMKQILGDDGYKKFLEGANDTIESTESMVFRYSPELSAPSEQVIAVAPAFWQPKTEMAATKKMTKPKKMTDTMQPAAEKEKQ